LQVLRRCQDSLTVADELLEYLSDGAVPGHPDTVLEALGGKLWALEELGETRNAIAVATEIVSLYGNEPEPTRRVREKVAWALAAKARLLVVAGAHSEVPPIVDDLVRRYGESRDPDVRVQVARALRSKASALAKLGQWDAVNKALDERTLEYAGITAEPGLGELAVEILGLRALALRRLGKLELAAALWGEKAEHYGVESSPRMRQLVAHALTQKAELLAATGENVQAIVVSDAVIECLSDLADRQEQIRLADALGAKGMALIGEARCEEAVGILDELIERFQDSLESALRRQVTIALANKVTALEHLDRVAAAASVFEDMITRFGAEALVMFEGTVAQFISGSEPEEREGLASALYGRGVSLDKLGRRDEALQTLDGLITRFETDENSAIKDIVSEARDARERTLDGDDDLTRPRTARRTRLAFSKSLQGSGLVDRVAR
jgi:tetratricopeptide (TPR) repeat protein